MSAGKNTKKNHDESQQKTNNNNRWKNFHKKSDNNYQRNYTPLVIEVFSDVSCPYVAWQWYLPEIPYSNISPYIAKLKALESYLLKEKNETITQLAEKKRFTVSVSQLLSNADINKVWPSLRSEIFYKNTELILKLLGLAKHNSILRELQQKENGQKSKMNEKSFPYRIWPWLDFQNELCLCSLKELKASSLGKLVGVQGTVVRVSNVKPICVSLAFHCINCQNIISVQQPEGKYGIPSKCPNCKKRNFFPDRSHRETKTVDWQKLRLQEIVQHESGRVPRTVEAELWDDLCDLVIPGDVITLYGLVKASSPSRKSEENASMLSLFLHGLSLMTHQQQEIQKSFIGHNSSTSYNYSSIQDIHALGKDLFHVLVHSLCPSIYGHEIVKAGCILSLFGGTSKYSNDRSHIPIRGDPHILIVGDPGLGKSQMLNSCASLAPRGVFVSGNTTTSSGLTVTLSRDSGNDFHLEAGALVLADQGHCCIDEFDKMSSQHQALLEAMEQQAISIAKGGLVCSLPARAAILAAANPIGGHYNTGKTVAENLKLSPALLSRFDLLFILIDRPDRQLDELLSDHILNLHSKGKSKCSSNTLLDSTYESQTSSQTALKARLKTKSCQNLIPSEILRNYIAYARQYVFPKLNANAAAVLQNFYLELRQRVGDYTPITLRQLESLLRLTEARAKIELREEANENDAFEVVEIMRESMSDVFTNEKGVLDFSRSQNGAGMSKKATAKKFISTLTKLSEKMQKNIFTIQEMKDVLSGIPGSKIDNFYDFISSLNNQGYLLQKSSKSYQLLSIDF